MARITEDMEKQEKAHAENDTVTLRDRDTMEQQRVKIEDVRGIINKEVDMRAWLMKM